MLDCTTLRSLSRFGVDRARWGKIGLIWGLGTAPDSHRNFRDDGKIHGDFATAIASLSFASFRFLAIPSASRPAGEDAAIASRSCQGHARSQSSAAHPRNPRIIALTSGVISARIRERCFLLAHAR